MFPTDDEIKAWATRERQRREQWAKGPSPEQAALAVLHERERNIAEFERASGPADPGVETALIRDAVRNGWLAAAGAVSLLFKTSARDAFDSLVREGLDWEDRLRHHRV
jgi:hypothetical protein